jgi:alkylation response protein AidB-like acyl-CoA dehydrogenase
LSDQGQSVTVAAAMAKMTATETAQKVIDAAVQMFGGQGVVSEEPVERLYREIRPLRIYEGATEVQQLIIARGIIKRFQESELSQGQLTATEASHLAGERKG